MNLRNRVRAALQTRRMEAAIKRQHQAKADKAWSQFYRVVRFMDLLPEEIDYVLQHLDPHHGIKKGGCGYCGVTAEELRRYGYYPCQGALWLRDLSATAYELRQKVELKPTIPCGFV